MTANHGAWSSAFLAVRSLVWTILLPGFFAGYLPWRLGLGRARVDVSGPAQLAGLLCIGVGRPGPTCGAPVHRRGSRAARNVHRGVRAKRPRHALAHRSASSSGCSWPLPIRPQSDVSQRHHHRPGRSVADVVRSARRLLGDVVPVGQSLRHWLRGADTASALRCVVTARVHVDRSDAGFRDSAPAHLECAGLD